LPYEDRRPKALQGVPQLLNPAIFHKKSKGNAIFATFALLDASFSGLLAWNWPWRRAQIFIVKLI
jgi:hypothetical protein